MSLSKKNYSVLVLIFLSVFFVIRDSSAGIMVSPGSFTMQNAEIGEDMDLGLDLIITNSFNSEQMFMIKTSLPSQAANEWMKGYSEIPDAGWLYFNEEKIKVKANDTGKLRMHLKIPDNEKYFNQRWVVYVEVTTMTEQGVMFKIAVKPGYMIETKSRADIKSKPFGVLGVAPSVVKAEGVQAGKSGKANFKVFNNDSVVHIYKIASYIPHTSADKRDISVSPGYEWVKDESWIKPVEAQMEIKPGEAMAAALDIQIPEGAKYSDQGWESIVFVEPDKGLSGFVRVLIEREE